jgi:hypothetical protein
VQEAHSEIIANLKNSHLEGDSLSEEELFKIRDINALQSAQLIHANQEYQKSVEIIVHRINDLNTLLNNYQNIWSHFCKPESSKFIVIKSKLTEKTSLINSQSFSLNQIYDNFLVLTRKVEESFNNSIFSINEKGDQCVELSVLRTISDSIKISLKENKEYNPIKQINGEIDKLEEGSKKLLNAIKVYQTNDTKAEVFPRINIKPEIDLIKSFSARITDFYNHYLNEQIDLFNGLTLVDTISSFSVEQVSYYKTFEKEAKEIINLLDNLLANINTSKLEINKERLEHLKNLYTMESEREIHQIVTGNKTSTKQKDGDNNENEVEFF